MLELASEGIYVRDVANIITLWYRSAQQMYGWTKKEAVGSVSYDLLQTGFPKPLPKIQEKLFRTGYWDGKLVQGRRDGRRLVVDSHWTLTRNHRGQPVEILEMDYDVTKPRGGEESALHRLPARLQRAQDEERRRIARELHDSTGQRLAALRMNLTAIGRSAASLEAPALRALNECITMAEECVQEIRTLSYLLHPPMLDERGLVPALRWFVDGFSRRSGMRVELEVAPAWQRLTPEMEIALFRVVQECLANTHRHAETSKATIRLGGDKKSVSLEVEDAGRGMTGKQAAGRHAGIGIMGMRERIRQFGGRLDIKRGRPGTIVRAVLPIKEALA